MLLWQHILQFGLCAARGVARSLGTSRFCTSLYALTVPQSAPSTALLQ